MKLDLDEIFGYYTIKYAHIKDRRLGFIQKALMLAIMIKIGVLTILYKCNHLLEVPVLGSARANAQQPTVGHCNPIDPDCMSNFTPLSDLQYCTQFGKVAEARKAPPSPPPPPADESSAPPPPPVVVQEKGLRGKESNDKEEDGKKAERKLEDSAELPKNPCVYWDAPAMTRGRSPVPGTLFLPTRVTETKQKLGCVPDASNGYKCLTKPWVHASGDDFQRSYMIADVDRFSVLINQAFSAAVPGAEMTGRAADFDGYVRGHKHMENLWTGTKREGYIRKLEKSEKDELTEIAVERPIPRAPDHEGNFRNIFASHDGDVFAVADILRMADLRGPGLLDQVRNADGDTMRWEGAVIAIDITYTNDQRFDWFGQTPPRYTVSAKFIPMKYYKIMYEAVDVGGETRTMHNVHGILFLINVKGYIKTFNLTHLLTVLTTAMVSLALAGTLTDYIMGYAPCLGLKDHYNILKYQASQDFSDLQQRINELEADCKRRGVKYDATSMKSSAVASTLNDYAEKANPKISDEHMLQFVCSFEQRLNCLDGSDANTTGDAVDVCVKKFRKEYMAQQNAPGGP